MTILLSEKPVNIKITGFFMFKIIGGNGVLRLCQQLQ